MPKIDLSLMISQRGLAAEKEAIERAVCYQLRAICGSVEEIIGEGPDPDPESQSQLDTAADDSLEGLSPGAILCVMNYLEQLGQEESGNS